MGLLTTRKKKAAERELASVVGDYELTPFPALVARALTQLADPEFEVGSVAELLANDPSVSIRLLRFVNSAGLSQGREIRSIDQAVVIIGRNQLESMLISLAVQNSLPSPAVPGFDRRRFWTTSARRAAVAGRLAAVVDPRHRAENFTAALLQDMALPLLAERADGYSDTLQHWHESPVDLASLERDNHGWHHGEIGSLMATTWELPESLGAFMNDHHGHGAADSADGLTVARLVAPIREGDAVGDEQVVEMAKDQLPVDADQVVEILAAADEEANEFARLLA